MKFDEAYSQLEQDFRARAEEDERQWCFESIFLPNRRPDGPVDFVLVGMEPSLRGWAKDFKEAQDKINGGFRNFFGLCTHQNPPKNSVLLFCISNYLCPKGETYHLTDLALGAMKPGTKGAGDTKKYDAWYPLFEKELGLVAKPNAKIISIGSKVGNFLSGKGLYGHAGTIPHYSRVASRHWGKEVAGHEREFRKFASNLQSLPSGRKLTCSTKKLMFDYKIAFERIRSQEESGWLGHQREWQNRLSAGR